MTDHDAPRGAPPRWLTLPRALPRPALALLVAVLVAGLAAAVVLLVVRPGDDTGVSRPATASLDRPELLGDYLGATGPAVAAVSTYDYHDLPGALAAGLPLTGGSYRQAYRAALTGPAAVRARQEKVVQSLDVRAVGLGALTRGGARASVLVFGVQRVSSTGGRSTRPITLDATVERTGGHYLITGLREDANAGLPAGSSGLRQAAEAARSEVADLLTFRRSRFDADAARVSDGATGSLRAELTRRVADTRAALNAGDYDLSGAVTAVAVRSVSPSAVTVLVAALGQRVDAGGARATVTDGRYAVAVVRTADGWLVDEITSYGT